MNNKQVARYVHIFYNGKIIKDPVRAIIHIKLSELVILLIVALGSLLWLTKTLPFNVWFPIFTLIIIFCFVLFTIMRRINIKYLKIINKINNAIKQ